jgi:hypothetical protein
MAGSTYIVFQQGQNDGWVQIGDAVEATTADAAIEQARTTAGTFVAVLVRSFRPRTHYAPPRPPAAPRAAALAAAIQPETAEPTP